MPLIFQLPLQGDERDLQYRPFMNPMKGHYKTSIRWLSQHLSMILFLVLFLLFAPLSRCNIVADSLLIKRCSVNQVNYSYTDSKIIRENWNFPGNVLAIKNATRKTNPHPPSDQRFYYEKRKGTADRGQKPYIIDFEGIFIGCLLTQDALICPYQNFSFRSWTGDCLKIRPPPSA